MEAKIIKSMSTDDLMKHAIALKAGKDSNDLHLATYRKLLGQSKVKASARFIKSIIEEDNSPVIVFAIHKQVIADLAESLKTHHPLVITGETPMAKRFEIINKFREDASLKVIMGNINAMGIGNDITKASRVVFVEYSWVPADNEQAYARAHRYGQENGVHVQYLVYENSIDESVLRTIFAKKKNLEKL